ncbi:hypothetical protein BDW59DRAFT_155046 [Aspergillus cavernicola]|uniref:DUF1993 domain-containing protein n=1 Tax=Aspergillus cavernicola TaxID=176166 RepID=A0ABR4HBS1_9EURO
MTSQIYTETIPLLKKGLQTLLTILQKAESHAKETNTPAPDLITANLIADMKPLSFQIIVAIDTSLKLLARASFLEPPTTKPPTTTPTFEDLTTRLTKTIADLENADPALLAANAGKTFKAPMGPNEIEFTPESYAARFAVPNFFFHVVTAYSILRAKGVPLGKSDYLTGFVSL